MIFRIVPYTNSWNISGWCVEEYWPICAQWVRESRLFITYWGANRAKNRMERGR